ncbi:MAG: NAD-dependent epimerase/dehydratase family protein [Clostridiales bacterium]|jgi:nucleoside-diphosphate-sugar epimerase|nr:NAD-dependent epimerase/dehydratase family protein [Clostridiales bacterium]
MNVLVIGGTGNISTAIVDRLNETGHKTTVFNRGLRPIRYKQEVPVIIGDKSDRAGFIAAMKGKEYDAVIDMISYNLNDAGLTLEAIPNPGTHFVFASTVAAYDRPYRGVPITERNALWTTEDFYPYGYHKARMEDFLWERAAEGRKITVIRPSLTYGVGCRNIGVLRQNYGVVERIKNGKPLIMFGDGTNPWSWTFAPDLAKAFVGALGRERCFGQAYHAASGDVRVWDELYYGFGRIVGKKPVILHMSTEMLMEACPEQITHVRQEKMFAGVFDNAKVKADIPEFVCEYDLDRLLGAIYDWYMSDEQARAIDDKLERLEDTLVEKYNKCVGILRG